MSSNDSMGRLMTSATLAGTLNYSFEAAGIVVTTTSSSTSGASVSCASDGLHRLGTVVDNRITSGAN
jgi:hypothetical protein